MTNSMFSNEIMAKYNRLAEIIRKHKRVGFGKLSVEAHMAPSTIHMYWKFMRELFPDLEYSHGEFFVKEERHHRMPNGKLVAAEK